MKPDLRLMVVVGLASKSILLYWLASKTVILAAP
jgi:hypothetical protein